MLLANIGANSIVVAAGLLHDSVDDSFVTLDHISASFGAGVADLVEGVRKFWPLLIKRLYFLSVIGLKLKFDDTYMFYLLSSLCFVTSYTSLAIK